MCSDASTAAMKCMVVPVVATATLPRRFPLDERFGLDRAAGTARHAHRLGELVALDRRFDYRGRACSNMQTENRARVAA